MSDCSGGVDALLLTLCLCHTSWVSWECFFLFSFLFVLLPQFLSEFQVFFCIFVCLSVCCKLPLIIFTKPFFLGLQVLSVGKPNEVSWPICSLQSLPKTCEMVTVATFACWFNYFWFVCEFACSFSLLSACLFFSNVDMHLHNVNLHCPWKPVCKQRGSHAILNIQKENIHKFKKSDKDLTQLTYNVVEFSCW